MTSDIAAWLLGGIQVTPLTRKTCYSYRRSWGARAPLSQLRFL